jgi:hypothetical protein
LGYVYTRAHVYVDDRNDEQATALHETDTGELRGLGFLTRHLGSVHSRDTVRLGVACRRRTRFALDSKKNTSWVVKTLYQWDHPTIWFDESESVVIRFRALLEPSSTRAFNAALSHIYVVQAT